ncbi:DNA mismatch endonuclease Vsr [Altererythrobacter halimionae]|uniref:Very short patch repair endonuclease n=1 Tax=Alteriqipengyuania halimionae TaxID=1926630 RepID=A0A6I4U5E0_9SPHN|nr:DNA mismatch endonuclease Vsr [Alteriqipengyuania halimionae]
MADIVSKAKRSRMMSGIRSKNTRPELIVRSALHSRGFRYRLHDPNLPGKPDLVFPSLKSAIFVNGCFWHGHSCNLFRLPKTNTDFWAGKIEANRMRDARVRERLDAIGLRHFTVWECSLRGRSQDEMKGTIDECVCWLEAAREGVV